MFIAAAVHKYTFGHETYLDGSILVLMENRKRGIFGHVANVTKATEGQLAGQSQVPKIKRPGTGKKGSRKGGKRKSSSASAGSESKRSTASLGSNGDVKTIDMSVSPASLERKQSNASELSESESHEHEHEHEHDDVSQLTPIAERPEPAAGPRLAQPLVAEVHTEDGKVHHVTIERLQNDDEGVQPALVDDEALHEIENHAVPEPEPPRSPLHKRLRSFGGAQRLVSKAEQQAASDRYTEEDLRRDAAAAQAVAASARDALASATNTQSAASAAAASSPRSRV